MSKIDRLYIINTNTASRKDINIKLLAPYVSDTREFVVTYNLTDYAELVKTHRQAVLEAKMDGIKNFLITTDRALLVQDTINKLENAVDYINIFGLSVLYLGGFRWQGSYVASLIEHDLVQVTSGMTTCESIIYSSEFYDTVLSEIPEDTKLFAEWIEKYKALDQWLVSKQAVTNVGLFEPVLDITHQDRLPAGVSPYQKNEIDARQEYVKIRKTEPRDKCYVVFTELKKYFLWQTELCVYSMIKNGGIDPKDIIILYSSDTPGAPAKGHEQMVYLKKRIFNKFGVRGFEVDNIGKMPWYFRLSSSTIYTRNYGGANKWTSLIIAGNIGLFKSWKEVVLLEQDLWFNGKMIDLPEGNVVTKNWINNYSEAFKGDKFVGMHLGRVLDACGVDSVNKAKWVDGSIIFKFTQKAITDKKLLHDIVNFTQLILVMGEIMHPEGARHESDMISPCLALAKNGYDVTCINDPSLDSGTWLKDAEVPDGMVVHYGWDFANTKHLNSDFSKFKYNGNVAPWDDVETLKRLIFQSKFKWQKKFHQDMLDLASNT